MTREKRFDQRYESKDDDSDDPGGGLASGPPPPLPNGATVFTVLTTNSNGPDGGVTSRTRSGGLGKG